MIDLYSKLFSSKPRKSFDTNSRVFADYNMRYNKLKEFVKPIKGTNEIAVYDPNIVDFELARIVLKSKKVIEPGEPDEEEGIKRGR